MEQNKKVELLIFISIERKKILLVNIIILFLLAITFLLTILSNDLSKNVVYIIVLLLLSIIFIFIDVFLIYNSRKLYNELQKALDEILN